MPFTQTRMVGPTTLTTSASSALYTVATGYSAVIKQIVVTNTTANQRTFTIYVGATASASTAIFSGTQVAASDSVVINTSQVLNAGDKIFALADAGSAVNLTISGVVNDGPLVPNSTYLADNQVTTNKIADNNVTQAKLATNLSQSGLRNVFINANFGVDQRGKSTLHTVTAGAANAYTVDRWYEACTGANLSAGTLTAAAYGVPFSKWYYFLGAAGNTGVTFGQRVEVVNCDHLTQNTATLSGYLLFGTVTSVTWTAYRPLSPTDFDGSKVAFATGTITPDPSSMVTRFQTQISVPSNATTGIEIVFTAGANTSGTLAFGGLQLEKGTQATLFEVRPYATELALCQRYYERITNSFYGVGHFYSTTMAYHQLQFNTPKRANASPSFSISSLSDFVVYCAGGGYTPTAMGFENITGKPQVNVVARTTIGTALTAGWSSLLYPAGGTSTGWIAVDCEL